MNDVDSIPPPIPRDRLQRGVLLSSSKRIMISDWMSVVAADVQESQARLAKEREMSVKSSRSTVRSGSVSRSHVLSTTTSQRGKSKHAPPVMVARRRAHAPQSATVRSGTNAGTRKVDKESRPMTTGSIRGNSHLQTSTFKRVPSSVVANMGLLETPLIEPVVDEWLSPFDAATRPFEQSVIHENVAKLTILELVRQRRVKIGTNKETHRHLNTTKLLQTAGWNEHASEQGDLSASEEVTLPNYEHDEAEALEGSLQVFVSQGGLTWANDKLIIRTFRW